MDASLRKDNSAIVDFAEDESASVAGRAGFGNLAKLRIRNFGRFIWSAWATLLSPHPRMIAVSTAHS